MTACRHIAVLIPARNEELLLQRCLESVLAAKERLPEGVSCDVIVVSDGSSDTTESVATLALGEHGIVLSTLAAGVGMARSLAADRAIARTTVADLGCCWLANTDADCEVPETWLLEQLRSAAEGVDAVAGIVDVDCFSEHASHVETSFRLSYRIHADGTHPHVHGANLGVRADAYQRAGGWGRLCTAEDHDLWRRLRDSGAVCQSDARLSVTTSGRRTGRAPLGFADALAAHNDLPEQVSEVAA